MIDSASLRKSAPAPADVFLLGLHPVLGRLLDMRDDGPAAGAAVLTYHF